MGSMFEPGIRVKGKTGDDKGKIGTIIRGTLWIGPDAKPVKPTKYDPTWSVL